MFQITTLEESHLQLSNVVQHLIIDEVWQSQPNNDNNTVDENSEFQSIVVNNTIIITPQDESGWYINLNTHKIDYILLVSRNFLTSKVSLTHLFYRNE